MTQPKALWQGFEDSWKAANRRSPGVAQAGSISKQGRVRPHSRGPQSPGGGNAIHSIADLAEAEDGLAAAASAPVRSGTGTGASAAAMENAFVLPSEDVFVLREREHQQRREAREHALKTKIWMRTPNPNATSLVGSASAAARAAAAASTQRNAASVSTASYGRVASTSSGVASSAAADSSGTRRSGGGGRGGAAASSSRNSNSATSENMAEFIAKKRVMFLIQTSLDTKNQEIQKLEEKAAMKEDALKKSEEMLAEDAARFNRFLEDNDNKVKHAIYQADRAAKKKNKKQDKIKRLHAAITRINTRIQKLKTAQLKYEEYETFLNSLLPKEAREKIDALKAARERAAKERPPSQPSSTAGDRTAAGSGGGARASKPPKTTFAPAAGGLGGAGGGGAAPGAGAADDDEHDSDDDSDDDDDDPSMAHRATLGGGGSSGMGGRRGGGGGDDEDFDDEDDDDDEAAGGRDAHRIGGRDDRAADADGGGAGGAAAAVDDDPVMAYWSDPELLFEMFEHLEEEILFKMQNVHEAEANLEALKALKLETEQKMEAQRVTLHQNIADLHTKIAAERLKVQAIKLRYQTDDDTKNQIEHEQRLTNAIRTCFKTVYQSKAANASGAAMAAFDAASVASMPLAGSGSPTPLPGSATPAPGAAPGSGSGAAAAAAAAAATAAAAVGSGAGLLVLDDAEKMMKDIEVELADRLKVVHAFRDDKPDAYAQIEKQVRDLIFRTSYPAQMKKEQLSQEQERIRKAEAQADKPVIKRFGKIMMTRSHLQGKPKKENTTPRKNQEEEDRLLFLSD